MAEISSPATSEFPSILNVLVIESDLSVLESIKKTCIQYSYQVMAFSESRDAVNILLERKTLIHLVLIEVHMPVMNGYEFLEFVKKERINVPVILMSEDDSKASMMKAMELGACDYFRNKPLDEDMFKNMWKHVFRNFVTEKYIGGINDNSSTVDRNDIKADDVDQSENSNSRCIGKDRLVWTPELHHKFLSAIDKIGFQNAVPKKILEAMDVPCLKRGHVASHLQKYRKYLRQNQEYEQNKQNEMSLDSGDEKPRIYASEENNNLRPLPATTVGDFHPGLTCNMGPTREQQSDSNVQVADNFHTQQTPTNEAPYPLRMFPNISITIPQSSRFGLCPVPDGATFQINNMQQSMMLPQVHPMNFQSPSIIIAENQASLPQNYNIGMNMSSPQPVPGGNNIGQVVRNQYNGASGYYPQPQSAGLSSGV